jgi:hypothetical protein
VLRAEGIDPANSTVGATGAGADETGPGTGVGHDNWAKAIIGLERLRWVKKKAYFPVGVY